jgi:hypothetical protein
MVSSAIRRSQSESEPEVDDAAGEVAFEVVDRDVVLVVDPLGTDELDRVGVLAGRAPQPVADLVGPPVGAAFVDDGGVIGERGTAVSISRVRCAAR